MSVVSMTGFARVEGQTGANRWAWEIKTVNGKSLDVRFRLPPGFDALEASARAALGAAFARGSCQIGLSLKRDAVAPVVRINQAVLDAIVTAMAEASQKVDAAAPRLDGLFAIKGVLEVEDQEEDEAGRTALQGALLEGFAKAIAQCAEMRRQEGQALARVLLGRIDEIEALTHAADANPARQPAAVRDRLAAQIAALLDASSSLDPDRLHQEAILMAAKADIREELDRLHAHIAAARDLLAKGGPVGRRLDFLAQEFNREVNTLCSKANDVSLTATGLSLKAVVEQFREQVQNIE
ncbi:YicC/YloC family endoribonuclease [Labrys sp. KB_33_2]|uniref:YicC/YloC family endoribonuclease n=1 Tax=unclassified Labrys (in: a-proteobacteria) TaxID=2688601 RepID=UPI003EB8CABB